MHDYTVFTINHEINNVYHACVSRWLAMAGDFAGPGVDLFAGSKILRLRYNMSGIVNRNI